MNDYTAVHPRKETVRAEKMLLAAVASFEKQVSGTALAAGS
jgi:hypothetical protein